MGNLVELRGLGKRYDGFQLSDIDLTVPAGCVTGLIGSNGAGKTTTLKILLGMIRADEGSVSLFGEELAAGSAGFSEALKEVGVVLDACAFPDHFTPALIEKVMRSAYASWDSALFNDYLSRFGLPAKKEVKGLSRGMGMKLSLAVALAHKPRLLVLDEATAGLDPLAREDVLGILRDYMTEAEEQGRECGILMSSHITTDLERIAGTIVRIDDGKLCFACETGAITEMAGVAKCRIDDVEMLVNSGFFEPGTLRVRKEAFGALALVPDRFAFAERFGEILVEPCDIDTYMSLMLKGERR